MTNTQAIEQAIETMRKASADLSQAIYMTANKATEEARALEEGLRGLLIELVAASDDCTEHFKRFPSDNGKDWSEQSEECRKDWSRAHDRRTRAEGAMLRYAQAVLKAEKNAA